MVCCALCGFESGFGLRVGVEVEIGREEGRWGKGVEVEEVEVVEGEEEDDDGEDDDRERGGG